MSADTWCLGCSPTCSALGVTFLQSVPLNEGRGGWGSAHHLSFRWWLCWKSSHGGFLWATFQLLHFPVSLAFSSPQVLGSILSKQVLSALLKSSHSPCLLLVCLGTAAVLLPVSEGCPFVCTQVVLIPFTFTSPSSHGVVFQSRLCPLQGVSHVPSATELCLQHLQPLQLWQKLCSRRDDLLSTGSNLPWHGLGAFTGHRFLSFPKPKAVCALAPFLPLLREDAATLGMSRLCATMTLGGEGAAICPSAKGFCCFPAELWCRQS